MLILSKKEGGAAATALPNNMTETESILQCGMCHRQHDGQGGIVPNNNFCVPVIQSCGRVDCAGIVQENLEFEAQRRRRRIANCELRIANGKAAAGRQQALRQQRPTERAVTDRRYSESVLPPSDRLDAREAAGQAKDVSAVDYETSANGRLLEFFQQPENFGKWFAAKFLEDDIGRTSGRMNNRAIWLRAQFRPMGLELDQHACPPGAELPAGSYYRVCRIEDALRLSAVEKARLIPAPVDRQD